MGVGGSDLFIRSRDLTAFRRSPLVLALAENVGNGNMLGYNVIFISYNSMNLIMLLYK